MLEPLKDEDMLRKSEANVCDTEKFFSIAKDGQGRNEGSVSPTEYIELNYSRVKGIADVGMGPCC